MEGFGGHADGCAVAAGLLCAAFVGQPGCDEVSMERRTDILQSPCCEHPLPVGASVRRNPKDSRLVELRELKDPERQRVRCAFGPR